MQRDLCLAWQFHLLWPQLPILRFSDCFNSRVPRRKDSGGAGALNNQDLSSSPWRDQDISGVSHSSFSSHPIVATPMMATLEKRAVWTPWLLWQQDARPYQMPGVWRASTSDNTKSYSWTSWWVRSLYGTMVLWIGRCTFGTAPLEETFSSRLAAAIIIASARHCNTCKL